MALMYHILSWHISNQDTVSFLSTVLAELHIIHSMLTWILKKLQVYLVASFSPPLKKNLLEMHTNTAEWEKNS